MKFKFNNTSTTTNLRVRIKPKNSASITEDSNTNPTVAIEEDGDLIFCLYSHIVPNPPISCEGATESITWKTNLMNNQFVVFGGSSFTVFKDGVENSTMTTEPYNSGTSALAILYDSINTFLEVNNILWSDTTVFTNVGTSSTQVRITKNTPSDWVTDIEGNSAYTLSPTELNFCLSPPAVEPPELVCDGANPETFCMEFDDTELYDVYVDDLLVPAFSNKTIQELVNIRDLNDIEIYQCNTPPVECNPTSISYKNDKVWQEEFSYPLVLSLSYSMTGMREGHEGLVYQRTSTINSSIRSPMEEIITLLTIYNDDPARVADFIEITGTDELETILRGLTDAESSDEPVSISFRPINLPDSNSPGVIDMYWVLYRLVNNLQMSDPIPEEDAVLTSRIEIDSCGNYAPQ